MNDVCPQCDLALTRLAVLALALRKIAVRAHVAHGNSGPWSDCPLEPCVTASAAMHRSQVEDAQVEGAA